MLREVWEAALRNAGTCVPGDLPDELQSDVEDVKDFKRGTTNHIDYETGYGHPFCYMPVYSTSYSEARGGLSFGNSIKAFRSVREVEF